MRGYRYDWLSVTPSVPFCCAKQLQAVPDSKGGEVDPALHRVWSGHMADKSMGWTLWLPHGWKTPSASVGSGQLDRVWYLAGLVRW